MHWLGPIFFFFFFFAHRAGGWQKSASSGGKFSTARMSENASIITSVCILNMDRNPKFAAFYTWFFEHVADKRNSTDIAIKKEKYWKHVLDNPCCSVASRGQVRVGAIVPTSQEGSPTIKIVPIPLRLPHSEYILWCLFCKPSLGYKMYLLSKLWWLMTTESSVQVCSGFPALIEG